MKFRCLAPGRRFAQENSYLLAEARYLSGERVALDGAAGRLFAPYPARKRLTKRAQIHLTDYRLNVC